jgi:undecaprenol kinase/diacylglycerol kinase (ATP)
MIFWKKLIRSFRHAFNGLIYLAKYERNFKVHLVFLVVILALAFYFDFSIVEFIIIIMVSGMVLITEAINSGIEIILDIIYPEHNGKSKIIKDALAGAVLVAASVAAIVGILLFIRHFS